MILPCVPFTSSNSFQRCLYGGVGQKPLKTTTANTDIKLSSGGEAPHLATITNEQHNIVSE